MATWKDWMEEAKEDLACAQDLGKTGRYSRACFHCQQSVEKALKALIIFRKDQLVKTHSLRELAGLAGVLEELKDLISEVDSDYSATRYLDVAEKTAKNYDKPTFEEHYSDARKSLELIEKWMKN